MNRQVPDNLSSFEALFRQYYAELCRYALKLTRNEDAAEEVVQEVFVNFWERRSDIRITHSVKAYLVSSVRNRAINYLKLQLPKDQRKEDIDDFHIVLRQERDGQDLEYRELYQMVQNAVSHLPEKCKAIFILSREEGLTYQEIADQLGLSLKTVENQMGIALRKLRTALKPYLDQLAVIVFAFLNYFL